MKKVLLLMLEGTEILEAASFYDVLGWSGAEGFEEIKVITAGSKKTVTCTFGLRILPDILFSEVKAEDYAALAIPGGFEEHHFYQDGFSKEVSDIIRKFDGLDKPIASICVGALPLASSGILKGRKATTYHLHGGRQEQLAEYGVQVLDAMVVRDKNIITSTSPASAPEVALILLEMLTRKETAAKIREYMGYTRKMEII
jgi:4-methyl-5(b-hydroxyethyl)-thiazole monophosphate biosynthesis